MIDIFLYVYVFLEIIKYISLTYLFYKYLTMDIIDSNLRERMIVICMLVMIEMN